MHDLICDVIAVAVLEAATRVIYVKMVKSESKNWKRKGGDRNNFLREFPSDWCKKERWHPLHFMTHITTSRIEYLILT